MKSDLKVLHPSKKLLSNMSNFFASKAILFYGIYINIDFILFFHQLSCIKVHSLTFEGVIQLVMGKWGDMI